MNRRKKKQWICPVVICLIVLTFWVVHYFNVIKSHYIVVTYNNDNSEDIVTALNAGRAIIADLDQYGIEYHIIVKVKE